MAEGGTLFLDEVAEIPLDIQARLLRVLQDGSFVPVGSTQTHTADVRIVSATHQALRDEVARGREVDEACRAALTRLDPDAREILVLREVEGLSYEDMAELLDVAVGTVRSRLHRARNELRRHVAGVLDA